MVHKDPTNAYAGAQKMAEFHTESPKNSVQLVYIYSQEGKRTLKVRQFFWCFQAHPGPDCTAVSSRQERHTGWSDDAIQGRLHRSKE